MIEVAIERNVLAGAIRVRHKSAAPMLTDDPTFDGQTIQRFLDGAETHPQRQAKLLLGWNLIAGRQGVRLNQVDDSVSELNVLGKTGLSRTGHGAEQRFR